VHLALSSFRHHAKNTQAASFTFRPLYLLGESTYCPMDKRSCGPQYWSGRCGEKKVITPAGNQTQVPRLLGSPSGAQSL
jgi:hypothetical protein